VPATKLNLSEFNELRHEAKEDFQTVLSLRGRASGMPRRLAGKGLPLRNDLLIAGPHAARVFGMLLELARKCNVDLSNWVRPTTREGSAIAEVPEVPDRAGQQVTVDVIDVIDLPEEPDWGTPPQSEEEEEEEEEEQEEPPEPDRAVAEVPMPGAPTQAV
jgi:hypothetical protein